MTALKRHRRLEAIWASEKGFRGWFSTVSHSDLGRMFLFTSFFYFGVAGILAMLIRAQLATPHSAWASEEVYAQLFTMHGTIMMFLFAIPAIEGMAVYLIPKMLGTRDLAYPRLTAYGFWCYAFGGAMMLSSLALGLAPDGGWFMYPPLSGGIHAPGINTDFWLIGITFVEISAICAAVELCVSILKYRAPGMSLDKMPIFAWYILVTALMILTGFPPLILGSILLELERAFGLPFFQADLGGDSLLWQHLFWLFGHPEVYIIFLPAAGILSTVIPVMARTTLLGYGWIVASIVALAFLSFGLWVHHMFTTGIPHMGVAFFSAASTLVAVPTAVQVFAWIGTMWKGRPDLRLPMLHILGFFFTFVIGGLTGVMVAIVPFDWQVHDTAFITAHLHYVLFGGFVFPILAGVYYWLPLVTGCRRFFKLGESAFVLTFLGFHGTFLAMHVLGLLGQRRRIHTYDADAGWTAINLIASIASFIMAIGLALALIDIIIHLFVAVRGKRSPWGAGTLEWATMSPPPSYNFASLPHITSREPYSDTPTLPSDLARGTGYLGDPQGDRRETLMVDIASGRPEALAVYPSNTTLPIRMAAVTGVFFLSLLLKVYWLTPFAVIAVAAFAVRWAWSLGATRDAGPQLIGRDMQVPLAIETEKPPGWWGSAFLLVANATFFGSLLFGYAFLWSIAPGWPPPEWLTFSILEVAIGIGAALAAPVLIRVANARVNASRPATPASAATLGTIVLLAVCLVSLILRAPSPTEHAYGATLLVLGSYGLFHAVLTGIMLAFVIVRMRRGYVSAARSGEPAIARLWVDYTAGAGTLCLLVAHVPAWLT
ncbi:cytochrome ubiquinol oxidase subunit I [Rhodobacterales bacterium HKCCE4037]|nr:cytochrome ubiquinol oxidase subunit I [Rhodobacterales bacterium HKCCE4037]